MPGKEDDASAEGRRKLTLIGLSTVDLPTCGDCLEDPGGAVQACSDENCVQVVHTAAPQDCACLTCAVAGAVVANISEGHSTSVACFIATTMHKHLLVSFDDAIKQDVLHAIAILQAKRVVLHIGAQPACTSVIFWPPQRTLHLL